MTKYPYFYTKMDKQREEKSSRILEDIDTEQGLENNMAKNKAITAEELKNIETDTTFRDSFIVTCTILACIVFMSASIF